MIRVSKNTIQINARAFECLQKHIPITVYIFNRLRLTRKFQASFEKCHSHPFRRESNIFRWNRGFFPPRVNRSALNARQGYLLVRARPNLTAAKDR